MQSLKNLRDYLVSCVPLLQENPENLSVFAKSGTIKCAANGSLSHAQSYTACVFITGWAGDTDSIIVPILAWVRQYAPELMSDQDNGITFEAELLSKSSVDLTISLKLSDNTIVKRETLSTAAAERWTVKHPFKKTNQFEPIQSGNANIYDVNGNLLATLVEPGAEY